jgi:hypothetical protein
VTDPREYRGLHPDGIRETYCPSSKAMVAVRTRVPTAQGTNHALGVGTRSKHVWPAPLIRPGLSTSEWIPLGAAGYAGPSARVREFMHS